MLQALLKQRGISSRVDGAQLQGGVGELPVSGFVRLVVEDEDYEPARAVIEEWESTDVPDPIPVPPKRPSRGIRGALIGLALGVAGSYAFFAAPRATTGVDNNDDGMIDEFWYKAANGTPIKAEVDRNFDKAVDYKFRYDRQGRVDVAEADDDFDGSFETRWQYQNGNAAFSETDTNGDSSIDLRLHLRYGVPVSLEYFVRASSQPVRIEYFHNGTIATAEVDSDRDGLMDTRHKYSNLAEIIATEQIQRPH
jgi:Putative prokaryotic signal transducing protein